MLQRIFRRSFRSKDSAISDTSKASELVLKLKFHQASANSGSPEFFVQKIATFTIRHPNNPKVSESVGYECSGCVVRRDEAGEVVSRVPAHLVCRQLSWSLFEKNRAFVGMVSMQQEKLFVTAEKHVRCRDVRPSTFITEKGIAS